MCWWKIEGDFLLTLFLRLNSKRDSLLVKFSRPKRHPTKGVSQWIIILENYS
ncbi:polysaccharide deacetylase, partial [Enterococcus faecium]